QPTRGFIDILISIVLMLPGTTLMGSTLPLLTRGLSRDQKELSVIHARVYGINTLGAFLGSILTGFVIIRFLGLPFTLLCLSSFNIMAGALMLHYSKRFTEDLKSKESTTPPLDSKSSAPIHGLILAFLTGFVSIGFEVVFMRS